MQKLNKNIKKPNKQIFCNIKNKANETENRKSTEKNQYDQKLFFKKIKNPIAKKKDTIINDKIETRVVLDSFPAAIIKKKNS